MSNVYTLDPTGKNPNNLIYNEIQQVTPNQNTAIVLNAGSYFTNGLIVSITNTNKILVRNVDYITIQLNTELTAKFGQEVCDALLFLGTYNTTSISVTYQCVGGSPSDIISGFQQLLQNTNANSQQLEWQNILNKPTLFTPNNHVNSLSDIYGFEPVVYAIERIYNILKLGNDASFQLLMQWVLGLLGQSNGTEGVLGLFNNFQNQINGQLLTLENMLQDTSPRGNRVLYSLINNSSIIFNPFMSNGIIGSYLNFNNLPNGFRLYWELESTLNTIGNYYYPNRGYLNVNNYESNLNSFTLTTSNLNNVLLAGTQLIITALYDYAKNGLLIDWYSFDNGLPTFTNNDFNLEENFYYQDDTNLKTSKNFENSYVPERFLTNIGNFSYNLINIFIPNFPERNETAALDIPSYSNTRKYFNTGGNVILSSVTNYNAYSSALTNNTTDELDKDDTYFVPGYYSYDLSHLNSFDEYTSPSMLTTSNQYVNNRNLN